MAAGTLIDTDIVVDCLRGYVPALQCLRALPEPVSISALSVAELYRWVRDGTERGAVAELISTLNVFPVDSVIAEQGGLLCRAGDPRARDIVRCVVGATAMKHGLPLVTLHPQWYPGAKKLIVPYKRA